MRRSVICGSRRGGSRSRTAARALLPVLVIVAAHSRFMTGRMIPTRKTEDLLLGSWELIRQLGRVPRRLIWDNETGIGRGGKLAAGVAAFTGTLATQIVQLRPRDPESKGIVERRNGFFETSFMPGRAFASPADFNAQFTGLAGPGEQPGGAHAQGPPGRSDRGRPGRDAAVAADPAAAGLAAPGPARPGLLRPPRRQRLLRRPGRDRPPGRRHRRPGPGAGPADGRVVADHARVWARGITVTDPAHVETARRLRQEFRQPRSPAPAGDLTRDLADYDRAFGLITADGEVA